MINMWTTISMFITIESLEHKLKTIDEKIKFLKIAIENTPIDKRKISFGFL